jgi:Tfp pilus assembly protein PilF
MRRQAGDWYSLSVCRLRSKEFNAAAAAARRAIQIRPDLPIQHALLAEIYQQSGQSELARQQAQLEQWLKEAAQNSGDRSGLK